jgi:hypothetical protein
MSGARFRLVDIRPDRGGQEYVRPTVLSEEEAAESLDVEVYLHELAGWIVTRGEGNIICRRGNAVRVVAIRGFTPFDDLP